MIAAISMPVALDVIIAVLLVATIVYAIVLNRKLATLRNAKAEMEALVTRFADSTAKAETGIQNLKAHASESGASLDTMTMRASGLAEELSFLIERGSGLANRIEEAIESARGKGAATISTAAHPDRKSGSGATPGLGRPAAAAPAEPSPVEAALRKSLRGVR